MNYLCVINLFRLVDLRAGFIQTEASVISRRDSKNTSSSSCRIFDLLIQTRGSIGQADVWCWRTRRTWTNTFAQCCQERSKVKLKMSYLVKCLCVSWHTSSGRVQSDYRPSTRLISYSNLKLRKSGDQKPTAEPAAVCATRSRILCCMQGGIKCPTFFRLVVYLSHYIGLQKYYHGKMLEIQHLLKTLTWFQHLSLIPYLRKN